MRVLRILRRRERWTSTEDAARRTFGRPEGEVARELPDLREEGLVEKSRGGMWRPTRAGLDMLIVLDVMES